MASFKQCNECEFLIYSCKRSYKDKKKFFPCYKCSITGEVAKNYLQKKRCDKFKKK